LTYWIEDSNSHYRQVPQNQSSTIQLFFVIRRSWR
jgi:hypothetical protein